MVVLTWTASDLAVFASSFFKVGDSNGFIGEVFQFEECNIAAGDRSLRSISLARKGNQGQIGDGLFNKF